MQTMKQRLRDASSTMLTLLTYFSQVDSSFFCFFPPKHAFSGRLPVGCSYQREATHLAGLQECAHARVALGQASAGIQQAGNGGKGVEINGHGNAAQLLQPLCCLPV